MAIVYRKNINIPYKELKKLFASVGWLNGEHPEKLKKAIDNSDNVFTAWEKDRLVGLINAIDDSELAVYVNYVLVHPDFQRHNIGSDLINMLRETYDNFLYILLMAEDNETIQFYEKNSFQRIDSIPMMLKNFD